MLDLLGRGRLRLDRGRRREPDGRGPRRARQELPHVDRRSRRAADPCPQQRALRPGQPDRGGGRRRRPRGRLARAPAGARRLGQRSGAALPLSELARLPAALGRARRPGLGARARALPRQFDALQRHPGRAAAAAARAGGRVLPAAERGPPRPDDGRCGRRHLDLCARPRAPGCARRGVDASRWRCWARGRRRSAQAGRGSAASCVVETGHPPRLAGARRRRGRGRRRPRSRRLAQCSVPTSCISTIRPWRPTRDFDRPGGGRVPFLRGDLVAGGAARAAAGGFRWRTDLVARGLAALPTRWSRRAAPSPRPRGGPTGLRAAARRAQRRAPGRRGVRRAAPARRVFTAGRLWDEGKNVACSTASRPGSPRRSQAAGRSAGRTAARSRSSTSVPLGRAGRGGHAGRAWRRGRSIVSPALYEPFGLAVLEAAQAGCALVLSDIPTFRELWERRRALRPRRRRAGARGRDRPRFWTTDDLPRRTRPGAPSGTRSATRSRPWRAACERAYTARAWRPAANGASRRVKIVYFTHSLRSCWNHGNAHFLRGVLSELGRRGHDVVAYEPSGAWSLDNLLRDHGEAGLDAFRPPIRSSSATIYAPGFDVAAACDGADLVIVHEWNEPALVAAVGRGARGGAARFTLLFHDTHHRAVSDPEAMRAFDLDGYDGVLAFGETLAEVYRGWGWGDRVFVWHEAADTHAVPSAGARDRAATASSGSAIGATTSAAPSSRASCSARRSGRACRSTSTACATPSRRWPRSSAHGGRYHGWLPNAAAPDVFARHLATVHVPRRFYVEGCPASRRSGSSRRWPAASRWSPRPGATARACSAPAATSSWRETRGRDGARICAALRDDADLRARAGGARAARPSAPATPAPTGSTN